jgi:septum formation protein
MSTQNKSPEPIFLLASSSISRLQLLAKLGYKIDAILSPDIDETPLKTETPKLLCKRLAIEKGEEVVKTIFINDELNSKIKFISEDFVNLSSDLQLQAFKTRSIVFLSADTVAAVGRRILEKTFDRTICENYLKLLSGRNHLVYTAVCTGLVSYDNLTKNVFVKNQACKIVESRLKFKNLTNKEIESFLNTNQWQGNAGGYTISGYAERFVIKIIGSYSSVIGLPSYQTDCLLSSFLVSSGI